MAVHSTQLATVNAVGTSYSVAYTVPANKRTIVKSIVAWNTFAGANTLQVRIRSGSTTLCTFEFHLATTGAAGDTIYELPWIVLHTGQTLELAVGSSSASVIISGAELILS